MQCVGKCMVSVHGVHHQATAVCAALVPADIQNMIRSMWSCEAPCNEDPPLGRPVREIFPRQGPGHPQCRSAGEHPR